MTDRSGLSPQHRNGAGELASGKPALVSGGEILRSPRQPQNDTDLDDSDAHGDFHDSDPRLFTLWWPPLWWPRYWRPRYWARAALPR